jgi:hypothetical protein
MSQARPPREPCRGGVVLRRRVTRVEGPGVLGSAQLPAWQLGGCVARYLALRSCRQCGCRLSHRLCGTLRRSSPAKAGPRPL